MISMSERKDYNIKEAEWGVHLEGKLREDNKIQGTIESFDLSLDALETDMKKALSTHRSPLLSIDEQIKLDSYLVYLTTTLYWMYLKLQGSDVSKHSIIHDLGRAKEILRRSKELNASLEAPRLDMPATKRFIAAGMHTRFVDMDGVMVTEEQYKRSLLEVGNNKIDK
ncbi:nuclear nucleic acid-binding protein C1D [Drosophila obscura]|uniref:nuclear nucleic acid-binding protein C1D n=1 Tax=Drosophila obscura TaxID=7282 RepID=UPI000BA03E95|nr:nuclear nucleic acid-binding protein C1D [Drosophila obscura]